MFRPNDKVLEKKSGRIFKILRLEKMNLGNGDLDYFVLEPCFPYDYNKGYVSYVPIDKSDVLLDSIMSEEEAIALVESIPTLECLPDVNPRERKNYYLKVAATSNRTEICKVIKTLVEYRDNRIAMNKPFSDFDRRLLSNLISLIQSEISIAMNMPIDMVQKYITEKTGFTL